MRKFKNETIVITKDAYFFLRNEFRVKEGYKPLNNEQHGFIQEGIYM